MKVHGKILAVTTRPVGAEVSQASTGAIVRVRDASMFDTTGGTLSFDGVEHAYVTADPDDDAGDSVTLAAPLTVEEGDRLAIVPVKQEVVATVRVWDDAEPVPAVVPLSLKPLLLEGVRSDQATAETVKVDWRDGDPIVAEVVGQRASIDAAYISNAEELLLEDQKTLGEKLAEAAAARAEAAERLAEAEQRLNDAFSEIELLPDDAYVAAAKQQAIDAAAITAQQKADAAEAAAKTYADQQAAAAEANAKAFATTRTDGLAKTLWSTALPGTTTAPKDSVWYRVDASGKIIAVYTQTASPSGGSWSARPITSEAIDNLDVGKLTVASGVINDLVAQHIAARSGQYITLDVSQLTVTEDTYLNDVLAEHIAARTGQFLTLDVSDLTVFGNLTSAYPSGRNFTFGEGGLQFVDTDGSILFNAPLDPSQPFTFSGEALLQALTTLGNFSMQGTENELSQSARWTISNGMSKPGSSAKVNVGWEARSTDIGSDWNAGRRGLIFWKTYAFISTRFYFPGSGDQIHRMDAAGTDGTKTNLTFVYPESPEGGQATTRVRIASGGFTVIGDHLYLFGPKHWGSGPNTPWFVQKMSLSADGLTATFVAEWEHAAHTTACIGRDGSAAGSNLLIGVNNFTPAGNKGKLSWQKRKSTDFTVVGSEWLNSDRTSDPEKNILYIEELTADMGGAYVMAYTEGSSFVYAQGPTTGAASESRSFRVKAGGGTTGVAWDGTRFWHHVPADAVLNKHSTTTWFGTYSGEKWWASYTWYDGTAPASETQMATPVPFTMIERASITFTIPPIPGIATAARRYLGRGATAPTRTGMSLDGAPMTGRVARSYPTRPGTTGVNPPPAASTFTGVSPARIESGAGGLVISGDGTGTWPVVENRVNQSIRDFMASLRPKSGSGGSSTTTSATSATTITGAGEVTFVAPPSGQVRIDVAMLIKTSVAGSQVLGGYQIRTTGNVDVYTTTSLISNANVEWIKTASWEIYTGLTPGTTYKLRPMFSSTGSTGSASASQTSYTATPIA